MPHRHILLNGMSIGGGGGFTVGREWLRHLALQRPEWTFTMILTARHRLHEELRDQTLPQNAHLHWAPPATASRLARVRFERSNMSRWATQNHVHALIQLTGLAYPGCRLRTLTLMQDPWPYCPEAWDNISDRILAAVKRRRHARTIAASDFIVWTSHYIRELIIQNLGLRPRREEVLYNGITSESIQRAQDASSDWNCRPMEILSVSNVSPYKRQALVIRAIPLLIKQPGLESLSYRIVGHCDDHYRSQLVSLTRRLGIADRVHFEGRIPDESVRDRMSQAKCFVLMSICESFGIPAIEAMSFGTPVVTSDCCAMPEVCGDAAMLCPPDDVAALASRLGRVLQDETYADELRRRGIERVKQFDWSLIASRLASILDQIIVA